MGLFFFLPLGAGESGPMPDSWFSRSASSQPGETMADFVTRVSIKDRFDVDSGICEGGRRKNIGNGVEN